MTFSLTDLKEIGIGISALVIFLLMVRYFLANLKSQRDSFCKIIENHIDHNTAAIEKLDGTLEKNTEVLIKISEKLDK